MRCRGGTEIQLTATEFELLRYLMRNPRRVLSKAQILDRVWNYDFGGQANVVELYISYLRKKIDANRPPMIHTCAALAMCCAQLLHELSSSRSTRPRPSGPAAEAAPQRAAAGSLGRHTLRRQLVIRVTALVALAALLITTATALATRQVLMSQLDRQLDAVTARVRDPVNTWPDRDPDSGLLRPGQPIGTLAVVYDVDGNPQSGGRLTERGAFGQQGANVTILPDAAVSQLAGVPTDGTKSSIDPSELGHYRVVGFRIVAGRQRRHSGGRRAAAAGRRDHPRVGRPGGTVLCWSSRAPPRPAPSSSAACAR